MGEAYLKSIHEFARKQQISAVHFQRGQRKEEVARPYLEAAARSSRLKQYFKEGQAWRTETVLGDSRDFGMGPRICARNGYALRGVG